MSKIHITLVGGQPAPVYHGIVATEPDKVVFIYSASSRKALDALEKEIGTIASEKIELDVTSPLKIKLCAERLSEQYHEDEITVNISSGLKSWSHWFGVVFDKCPNASVVYMDQNNVLWNYRTMQASSDFEFDMHVLFRLYGNPLNNYTSYTDYTDDDFDAIPKIEQMRRFNYEVFNSLATDLNKKKRHQLKYKQKGNFTEGSSMVEWDKDNTQVTLSIKGRKYGLKEEVITSPHIVDLVFNASWFELKVAKLLSGWNKSKEICMNCRFPFKPNFDKNEVDIIVNTGVKNLFVECKTQIYDTTAIEKFCSVIKDYGGLGSKGLFVTDAPMEDMAKTKCEEHGILTFSLQEQHLGMSMEKALYWLLDSELYNINTK